MRVADKELATPKKKVIEVNFLGPTAFSSELDQLPPKSLTRRTVVLGGLSVLVTVYLFAFTSSFFTKADLSSLPVEEQLVLDRIRQIGVEVKTQRVTSFGAPAHIIPHATWQYSRGQAAITSVTLVNVDVHAIKTELQQLANLQVINVPCAESWELDRLRKQFPTVKTISN